MENHISMKKLIGIGIVLVLVAFGLYLLGFKGTTMESTNQTGTTNSTTSNSLNIDPTDANLEDIGTIHETMDLDNLDLLEQIIESNQDGGVREQAIMTYGDIALRTGNSEQAMDFLKGIALDEQNDSGVQEAAIANYYYLKEQDNGTEQAEATFDASVMGNQTVGSNLTIVLDATVPKDADVRFVIMRIGSTENDSEHLAGEFEPYTESVVGKVQLLSENPISYSLVAGETKEVPFILELDQPGKYTITCGIVIGYDFLDYEEITKEVEIEVQ